MFPEKDKIFWTSKWFEQLIMLDQCIPFLTNWFTETLSRSKRKQINYFQGGYLLPNKQIIWSSTRCLIFSQIMHFCSSKSNMTVSLYIKVDLYTKFSCIQLLLKNLKQWSSAFLIIYFYFLAIVSNAIPKPQTTVLNFYEFRITIDEALPSQKNRENSKNA